jgi:hypothetical protein
VGQFERWPDPRAVAYALKPLLKALRSFTCLIHDRRSPNPEKAALEINFKKYFCPVI